MSKWLHFSSNFPNTAPELFSRLAEDKLRCELRCRSYFFACHISDRICTEPITHQAVTRTERERTRRGGGGGVGGWGVIKTEGEWKNGERKMERVKEIKGERMLSSLLHFVWVTLLICWDLTASVFTFYEPTLTHTHTNIYTWRQTRQQCSTSVSLCQTNECIGVSPEDVLDLKKQVNMEVKLISI